MTLDSGLELGYRELGSGPAVLLLHGWPSSSLLWRNVMPAIGRSMRAVALDLPGFGGSDKPRGARYGFEFFEGAIDGFLAALGLEEVGLAVHDLGGPIGLHWALGRPGRVTKLALLNTLVYPEFSQEVIDFVTACSTPGSRERITSREGFAEGLERGLADQSKLTPELLDIFHGPFSEPAAREALADAGIGLSPDGFRAIAASLRHLQIPVRIIYGEQDRLLPDVAATMARVKRDLPHAVVTALPDCGHFLQEEAPDAIGEMLAEFFASQA